MVNSRNNPAGPYFKFAGGKRRLVKHLDKYIPEDVHTYIEPFVGAGALFWHVRSKYKPKECVLIDRSFAIYNVHTQVKNNHIQVMEILKTYAFEYFNMCNNKRDYYMEKRDEFNAKSTADTPEHAALFLFLNRTGFNGLLRYNKNHVYNVSFGARQITRIYFPEQILAAHELLQGVKIRHADFTRCERYIKKDKNKTLIYFDPPYHGNFSDYTAQGFTDEDHIRLSELFSKVKKQRNVMPVLSNSNTDFIRDLYKDHNFEDVRIKYKIGSSSGETPPSREVIVS